jgi:hypothetical protein
MKRPTLMSLVIAAGISLPAMNAVASGFGGGWKHDKHTGTLYWSLAPEPVTRHEATSHGKSSEHLSNPGGAWVYDDHTDTVHWSMAPDRNGVAASPHGQQARNPNSFGRGWAHDVHTGTLSYNPASYGDRQVTAYD